MQFPQAVLAKSEEVLELIEPGVTVIVDPPRAGCERRLLERILESGARGGDLFIL